MDGQGD